MNELINRHQHTKKGGDSYGHFVDLGVNPGLQAVDLGTQGGNIGLKLSFQPVDLGIQNGNIGLKLGFHLPKILLCSKPAFRECVERLSMHGRRPLTYSGVSQFLNVGVSIQCKHTYECTPTFLLLPDLNGRIGLWRLP